MSPVISKETLLARIDELLTDTSTAKGAAKYLEGYHGALSVIRVAHGPSSAHEAALVQAKATAEKPGSERGDLGWRLGAQLVPAVQGALRALKADVSLGLTGNIAMQAAGEELGNFLTLAKRAAGEGGKGGKNVAAVLVAAAFEDTLRRLAEAKARVSGRPKLEEIITHLKTAGVLVGASVSTANGHLKFRNDALHADWDNIEAPAVDGCAAFTESLLLQHF